MRIKEKKMRKKDEWSEEKRREVYNRFKGLLERASKQLLIGLNDWLRMTSQTFVT